MSITYNGNAQVKRGGVPHEFTKHEVLEYTRCMNDIDYFTENYVQVISLDHGLVPFKLRGYQKDLLTHYDDNRFSIVLAPRQSGKSIVSVAWLLHFIVFNADKKVAILANKGTTAREMLARFTLMLENLPFFLQPGVETLNKGNIVFSHRSEIIAAATSSSSIRGLALHCIFLDEFAFVQNDAEFYTSTYPVISSGADTKVIITSTPNGIGNMFYKIWEGAQQKTNQFAPFRIKWDDVPGRDEKWKAETIANTSELQFRQEFSCVFVGSSKTLVDTDTLLAMSSTEPIGRSHGILYYNKPTPGHTYILVADVSKGRGQDYSTFSVIDVSDEGMFKQVATYRDNLISPLLFPEIIVRAAKQYNDALVIVENNDTGQVVCNSLYYDHEYENMFTTSAVKTNGIGVLMTRKIKRIGCSNVKDLLEAGKLLIQDSATIQELTSFGPIRDSWGGAPGTHDDMVMNLVLFGWFVASDVFQSYSDIELKNLLYREKLQELEEDMPGFGFIDNGRDTFGNGHYEKLAEDLQEWRV